jgi:hypothetical protein
MVRDIDDEIGAHPCAGVRDRLDAINTATCDNHHGDDPVVVAKKGVDPDALRVIAKDALELIGARRPAATMVAPFAPRPFPAITVLTR